MNRLLLRLIAITDEPHGTIEDFTTRVAAAVGGGATCVQLRAKETETGRLVAITRALVRALPVPVIVNDRADVAIVGGAAGVHLGADDLPVRAVRGFAPPGFIIGVSVGNDEELEAARGADYVGVGPVFATGSKSDAGPAIGVAEMARLVRASGCPGVAIGGISARTARSALDAGADGVAVLSAIFQSADAALAAQALASAIEK